MPSGGTRYLAIAQPAEQLTLNQQVVGSKPTGETICCFGVMDKRACLPSRWSGFESLKQHQTHGPAGHE